MVLNELQALALVINLIINKCYASTYRIDCKETARKPNEKMLKQMYNEWIVEENDFHKTFEMIPPLYKTRYKDLVPDAQRNLKIWRIYGDPKCYKRLNKSSHNLMDNSLCPWYTEMTYDTERYPEYMARARCKCTHCYGLDGLRRPKQRSKNIDTPLCKEIKQTFKILRLGKNEIGKPICDSNDTSLFQYQKSYEEITVGCTCVQRRVKALRPYVPKPKE